MHHPDGEAALVVVVVGLQPGVVQSKIACSDALDADIGVLGTERAGSRERRVGERIERQ
jgi:hypothetical protein